MKLFQNRSKLFRSTEQILLEPLLSSNPNLDHSFDGLSVGGKQSICLTFISKVKYSFSIISMKSARSCCFASLRWLPVLFIVGIIIWSYYAYVVQLSIYTIESVPKKVIYLIIYHLLLILFLCSYYRTIFKSIVGPTNKFYLNKTDAENVVSSQTVDERRAILVRLARQSNLPLLTRHFDGSIRYCFICHCIKPDRAHHCSVCGKCVLRYDHHCPWTNSCVSYGNYKYFILFLGYALLFCLYVAGTSVEYFIYFWQGLAESQKNGNKPSGEFHLLFLFFVSIIFAISVSSLFFYHLYLTGKNRTTVESFRAPIFATGPEKDGFNLGCKENYKEVFGNHFFKAFLPISTTRNDGIHYQTNSKMVHQYQEQQQHSNRSSSMINRSNDTLISIESPFYKK